MDMPEISKFFGITISLYWRDHNPPHIHINYGEYACTINVLDRVVSGQAPSGYRQGERMDGFA